MKKTINIRQEDGLFFIVLSISLYFLFKKVINIEVYGLIFTISSATHTIYKNNQKEKYSEEIRKKQAMEDFFMKIYFDDLSVNIPNLLHHIKRPFGNETKSKCNELIDTISNLKMKIEFYKLINEDYYRKIRKNLDEIDDFICLDIINQGIDTKIFERNYEKQNEKCLELEEKIKELFDEVMGLHL